MASIEQLVQLWLKQDQNQTTRHEIATLWENGNNVELEKRLRKRIEFGTAGLRGRMEAGFSRMNDLVIIQASQGLCSYVLATVTDARQRGLVVGHDHRYNSERWANLTAAVFLEKGFKVYLHSGLVHTPIVPFTVQRMKAAAGVMITASHNPKDDNGYKVYWENAVQIISPHDSGIAAAIRSNLTPGLTSGWDDVARDASKHLNALNITQEIYEEYIYLLKRIIKPTSSASTIKFVTTPMHGVGQKPVMRALHEIGVHPDRVFSVVEQQDPDPDFPTVLFPNPEEHGALDLAIKKANLEGATYVLAQDPDADRFTAAQKQGNGTWHQFLGDQLGSIFAARALQKYMTSGKPIAKLAMVASTVSSKMIEAMAQKEGFKFVECLTGFKYIGNVALQLDKEGYEVPFAYEEAIGYMVETNIRDKDGVSATVAFVELVAELHTRGLSALQYLEQLYERYGYFETRNSYFICNDPSTIDVIFTRLRNFTNVVGSSNPQAEWRSPSGASYPASIGSLQITSVRDLTSGHGYDSAIAPHYQPDLPLSGGHMITFRAGSVEKDGVAITLTIRTSGTEPKIKYYLEAQGSDRGLIGNILQKVVEELKQGWMQVSQNGLASPELEKNG